MPHRLKRLLPMLISLICLGLIGGGFVVYNRWPSNDYEPSIEEQSMFAHLRVATNGEAGWANTRARKLLRQKESMDVFVATDDLRTIRILHPILIILKPGKKWLGGPLGMAIIVTSTNATGELSPDLIYDWRCQGDRLGMSSTGCWRTIRNKTDKQGRLRPLTGIEQDEFLQLGRPDLDFGNPHIGYEWTTLEGDYAFLKPAKNTEAPMLWPHTGTGSRTIRQITVIPPHHWVTGGELGQRLLVGWGATWSTPSARRHREWKYRIVLWDAVPNGCKDLAPYLGPEVLQQYAEYCN